MQAQPTQNTQTQAVYPRQRQAIVLLKMVPILPIEAKKAFLSGETLFVSWKKFPISFMESESIHISNGKSWKPCLESWASRNGKSAFFFRLERSEQGKF